jgi:pimeloyl-ACP methyl ester carboxylesterase
MDEAREPPVVRMPGAPGIALAVQCWGRSGDPAAVLLHGGGQTRHAWRKAAVRLAEAQWRVLVPDLRGHGDSDWSPDRVYGIETFAEDVRGLMGHVGPDAVLVGASLGGLASMLAIGEAPRVTVRGLVLVDVAHRPEPAGASRVIGFMRAHPEGFATLEDAAAEVAAYLAHRAGDRDPTGLQKNLRWRDGRWRWHWDPTLLDGFSPGGIAPERYLAAAASAGVPTLLVRGSESDVVSEAIAAEFCAAVAGTERVDVPNARHMVAGDCNERFLDAIVPWLSQHR